MSFLSLFHARSLSKLLLHTWRHHDTIGLAPALASRQSCRRGRQIWSFRASIAISPVEVSLPRLRGRSHGSTPKDDIHISSSHTDILSINTNEHHHFILPFLFIDLDLYCRDNITSPSFVKAG